MAEDFRIRIGFFRHHKALKLVRRLGLEGLVALLRLWEYAAEFRTNGDLAGMTAEDIDLAAGWNSEVPFVPVLVEIGFLDEGPDSFALHDWQVHNPWVAEAEERSDAARLSRLHRENPEAAARLKAEGRTGLTSEEYATFKRSTTVERPLTSRSTPAPAPAPAPEPKEKAEEDSSEPSPEDSKPSATVLVLPLVGKVKEGPITQADLDEWQALFPGIDVLQVCRNIVAWNQANPTRRKTITGYKKHIVSWLSREQDKGNGSGNGAPAPGTPGYEQYLAQQVEETRAIRAAAEANRPPAPEQTAACVQGGFIHAIKEAAKNSRPMPDFVRKKFLEGGQ